jgi:hypothetical protein
VATPVPTPVPFPAMPGVFPLNQATTDPLFGVNPYAGPGQNMYVPRLFDPNLSILDVQARRDLQQQLIDRAQVAAIQQLGIPLNSDPHTWTPAEAAQQTDNAIARIAAVNPKLAEQLAAQRTPGASSGGGGGFFDSLKSVIGEALHPAISLGGKLLDIVSRTANIVPNIVYDAVDGGSFNLGGDIGGALTGKVRHNWNGVFQQLGWTGGGPLGVLRATLGFIGDTLTDPLTWVIPAGAGVHASEAAAQAGREVALHADTVWTAARKLFVDATDEEIAAKLAERERLLTQGIRSAGLNLGEDAPERVWALVGSQWRGAEQEMLRDMFELSDQSYRLIRTGTFGKALRAGAEYALSSGRTVTVAEARDILEQAVRAGAMTGRESDAWRAARAIASSLGGVRLKFAVPFTEFRYISPALGLRSIAPWLDTTGLGLQSLVRFFAGQSGMTRMVGAIASGKADWADLRTWMEEGWSGLQKSNPEVLDLLRGRGKNLASMYYSASEMMGGITAHFSSGARATRTGLAGYLAHAEKLHIQSIYNQFVRETAYGVEGAEGRAERDQLIRDIEGFLGLSSAKKRLTATPEQMLDYAKYLDYFPSTVDAGNPKAIEDWFWSLPEHQAALADMTGPEAADRVAGLRATLEDMKSVAARLNPKQRETLNKLQAVWEHARTEAAKYDAFVHDVRMSYEQTGRIHPTQVRDWQGFVAPELRGTWYMQVEDAGLRQQLKAHGITDEAVVDGERIRGIQLSRLPGGEAVYADSMPVVLRGKDWVVIDQTGQAALSDDSWLREAEAAYNDIMDKTAQATAEVAGVPVDSLANAEQLRRNKVAGVTEQIRKEHPEASGVVFRHADGRTEVIVFQPSDVKLLDETAPRLTAERGYFHRTFTQEVREWLHGKLPTEGRQLLVTEPEVEAYLRRQTYGMTLEQADTYVRQMLVAQYGAEGLPARIFETNPLKVHGAYIDQIGQAIEAELLGKASRRMTILGDLAPTMFGRNPRGQRYEWMLSPSILNALKHADKRLSDVVMEANARGMKYMEEFHRQQAQTAERFGLFAAMVEERLAAGLPVPDRFTLALRSYGKTMSEATAAVQREMEAVDKQLAHWHALEQEYGKLRAQAAQEFTKHGLGHPDLPTYRQLKDGSWEILAWHGTHPSSPSLGDIEEVINTPGDEFGYGAMHVGSHAAATQRVYEYDPNYFDSGETYDIHVMDSEGKIVKTYPDSADGWNLQERIAEIQDQFPDYVVEPELQRSAQPDDYVYPVRIHAKKVFGLDNSPEGKAIGADWLLAGRDVTEHDLHPMWGSGANADLTSSELPPAYEHGPEHPRFNREELLNMGYDALAYINDIEDRGVVSFAVLEPDVSAFHAEGASMFEKLAQLGELYVGPDGSMLTKEGALRTGGRRIISQSELRAQAFRLEARKVELEKLMRGLRSELRPTDITEMPVEDLLKLTPPIDAEEGHLADHARRMSLGEPVPAITVFYDPKLGKATTYFGGEFVRATEEMQKLGLEPPTKFRVDVQEVDSSTNPVAAALLAKQGVPWHPSGEEVRQLTDVASRVAANTKAVLKRMDKESRAAARRLEHLKMQTMNIMNEANKAYAEFHGAVAQVRPALVKIETAGDLGGLTRLRIPGLEGYAMPAYIAEEWHHLLDKHGPGYLRDEWRKFVLGPWKRWATYRWPGFHVRNFYGAWFNNWLGGVVEPDYVFSWRVNRAREGVAKWAERLVDPAEWQRYHLDEVFGRDMLGKVKYADIANLMAEQGIGRANTMAVLGAANAVDATQEMYDAVGKANPGLFRRAARSYDVHMRHWGTTVEDFHRTAAWGAGMAATKGDLYGARAFVMMRHGDYSDLTDAEDFIRDLVPFYKWLRTNTPYQIRMLAENPGQLTLIADKLKTWAFNAEGFDRQQAELAQPEWMKQDLTIPIPRWVPFIGSKGPDAIKYAMFNLPYSDLYNGLNDYMSSALPVVRNVLESYGFKQTLFTGSPLTGKYVPLSGAFDLPGIRQLLAGLGIARRGADGRMYIQDKMQNVLMGWPIYSRFRNFVEGDPDRAAQRLGGLFSMLSGVGLRDANFTTAELDFYNNEVAPLLEQYRSLGIQLPTINDIQSAEVGQQLGFNSPPTPSPAALAAQFPNGVIAA